MALTALALVVFGTIECPPIYRTATNTFHFKMKRAMFLGIPRTQTCRGIFSGSFYMGYKSEIWRDGLRAVRRALFRGNCAGAEWTGLVLIYSWTKHYTCNMRYTYSTFLRSSEHAAQHVSW